MILYHVHVHVTRRPQDVGMPLMSQVRDEDSGEKSPSVPMRVLYVCVCVCSAKSSVHLVCCCVTLIYHITLLLPQVLTELDNVLACPPNVSGTSEPLDDASVPVWAIDSPYLLSGARVTCGPSGGHTDASPKSKSKSTSTNNSSRRVYRLTPRCLDDTPRQCPSRPSDDDLRRAAVAEMRIFSGVTARPVPGGVWFLNPDNSSAAGFWIIAPP